MEKKLNTIKIKGKSYVMVHDRILAFHEKYPNGSIHTKILHRDENTVVVKAMVVPDTKNPLRSFIGHSEEFRAESMINKTSAIENAETSAVGRALGMLGIGILEGLATAEEIKKAQNNELPVRQTCNVCGTEFEKAKSEVWKKTCLDCFKKDDKPKAEEDKIIDVDEPPF